MIKNLGCYVRTKRKEMELTQQELAERCELTRPAVSMIESEKRKKPRPETLRKLAKGLKIPYEQLLEEAGYLELQEENSLLSKESVDLQWILGHTDLRFQGKILNEEQRGFLEIFIRTLLQKEEVDQQRTKL